MKDFYFAGRAVSGSHAVQHSCAIELLISLAKENYGLTLTDKDFLCAEGKAPEIIGMEGIYISLSHTKDYVCAAISSKPVGIDAEYPKDVKREILDRFCRAFTTGREESDREKTETWTKYESYIKMTGKGLAQDDFSLPHDFFTFSDLGAVVSVCIGRKKE